MRLGVARWGLLALVSASLAGCLGGGDGGGTATTSGSSTPASVTFTANAPGTSVVDAASMTSAQWADGKMSAEVGAVTISSPPTVYFKVRDAAGNPVKGLGFTTKTATDTVPALANLAFSIAKLVPGSNGQSNWVNYIVVSSPNVSSRNPVPNVPSRPTTENYGTLVDNGDGTYRYTFARDITGSAGSVQDIVNKFAYTGNNVKADLGDLTYEPNRTHRVVIQISGNARGTGTNTATGVDSGVAAVAAKTPVNLVYDFIPATGKAVTASDPQRNIVDVAKCNECHGKLNALGFHGGTRNDSRICVVCHTDQRKYGQARSTSTNYAFTGNTYVADGEVVGDFPVLIHKIHRGSELTKTGYNFANVMFNDIVYSMSAFVGGGQRMCSKCHANSATTPQGDNWNTVPSVKACRSCHDGIDFATGTGKTIAGATTGHRGGAMSDSTCTLCHSSASIKIAHQAENVTPNNPTIAAGLANFTYEIASASVDAANTVSVKFRIMKSVDGSTPTPVTFVAPAATVTNPLSGFTGGPSFILAYAMPQDGVTTPADYNNLGAKTATGGAAIVGEPNSVTLANLLSTSMATSAGTMVGPDASGYYTASIVGANRVFPVGAKMRTVGLNGYFTQVSPAAARHAVSVVKTVSGDTARRDVVSSAKCANCHEWIEGHGGNRVYDIKICLMCHNPNKSTSGRGIPDATVSSWNFTAEESAILARWGFNKSATNAATAFPASPNNFKDMIHGMHAGKDRTTPFRDVRDRTPSALVVMDFYKAGFPNILSNCEACHAAGTYNGVPATGALASTEEYNNASASPMTPAAYKSSFAQPNATDKVTTPFAAACVSCHDSSAAQGHMSTNGALIKQVRSKLTDGTYVGEACAVCHGSGREYEVVAKHKDLK